MADNNAVALLRRPELHARAHLATRHILAHYDVRLPEEAREILCFYQSTELSFDRAAEHVVALASRLPRRGAP